MRTEQQYNLFSDWNHDERYWSWRFFGIQHMIYLTQRRGYPFGQTLH